MTATPVNRPETIDVTGLPESVVQDIRQLVKTLREQIAPIPATQSIFHLFGKAAVLRTGEDIAAQVRQERDAWEA
jgi:hypothetical protein